MQSRMLVSKANRILQGDKKVDALRLSTPYGTVCKTLPDRAKQDAMQFLPNN